MADITGNWNAGMPSNSSPASLGDDLLRQHWGSLRDTLLEEHYFSDSSTSAGIHKLGSARVYFDTASAISTSGEDQKARLFYASDETAIYVLSDTTSIKLTQDPALGGPVKSQLSADQGWYISSYRTDHKGALSKYSFVNASGNPTLVYNAIPQVLGITLQQASSSVTSVGLPLLHSVTSSYLEVTTARYQRGLDDGGQAGDTFGGIASSASYVIHISVMGLLNNSLLS